MSFDEQIKRCQRIQNVAENLPRILQAGNTGDPCDISDCICWHPIRVAAICGDIDVLRDELSDANADYELDYIDNSCCHHAMDNTYGEFNWPELTPEVENEFMGHREFYHAYMSLKHNKLGQIIHRYYDRTVSITLKGHTLTYDFSSIDLREFSDLEFKYSLRSQFRVQQLLIQNYDNLDERFQKLITEVTLYRATPAQIRAVPIHYQFPYSTQYVIDNGIDPYTYFEIDGRKTLYAWFLVMGICMTSKGENTTYHMNNLIKNGNRPLDCFYPKSVHNRPDRQKEIILACYQSMRCLPKFLRWEILHRVFREPLICGLVYKEEYAMKLKNCFMYDGVGFNPDLFRSLYMESTVCDKCNSMYLSYEEMKIKCALNHHM